jgi:ubiquitin-protein ligase
MKTKFILNLTLIISTLFSYLAQANHSKADNIRQWEIYQQAKESLNNDVKQYCSSSLEGADFEQADKNISNTQVNINKLLNNLKLLAVSAEWTPQYRQSLIEHKKTLEAQKKSCDKQAWNLYKHAKQNLNNEVDKYCNSTIYGSDFSEAYTTVFKTIMKIDDQFSRINSFIVGIKFFDGNPNLEPGLFHDKASLETQKEDCFKRNQLVIKHFYPDR